MKSLDGKRNKETRRHGKEGRWKMERSGDTKAKRKRGMEKMEKM
jgi:hypothetical protein